MSGSVPECPTFLAGGDPDLTHHVETNPDALVIRSPVHHAALVTPPEMRTPEQETQAYAYGQAIDNLPPEQRTPHQQVLHDQWVGENEDTLPSQPP